MALKCGFVEVEIRPQPPEGEREALDEALARLLAEADDPRSDWWRAGVRETLSPEAESG